MSWWGARAREQMIDPAVWNERQLVRVLGLLLKLALLLASSCIHRGILRNVFIVAAANSLQPVACRTETRRQIYDPKQVICRHRRYRNLALRQQQQQQVAAEYYL